MLKKVIIVEDDAVTGFVYRTGLVKEGYDVELAKDGEVGLARILAARPAAVLLDLMLPKMPGLEVLKKLREQPHLAKIPVIVFTNAHVPEMIDGAKAAGATRVLNKAETTPRLIVQALRDEGCFARDL